MPDTNTKKIWVIDDEDQIRDIFGRALGKQGYNTETFPTADEALERIVKGESPDAIICDFLGTGLDADQFYKDAFPHLDESVLRYIVTGTPEIAKERVPNPSELGISGLFTKPFDLDEIRNALAAGFEKMAGETAPKTKKLWIVESNTQIRELFLDCSREHDFDTSTFESAEDALKLLERGEKPDAVTASIGAGAVDLYLVGEQYLGNSAKFLFTGGYDLPDSLKAKNVGLIRKPVSFSGFVRHIEKGVGIAVPSVWEIAACMVGSEIRNEGYDFRSFSYFSQALQALDAGEKAPDAVVAGYKDGANACAVAPYAHEKLRGSERILIGSPADMQASELEAELGENPEFKGVKVFDPRDKEIQKRVLSALEAVAQNYRSSAAD